MDVLRVQSVINDLSGVTNVRTGPTTGAQPTATTTTTVSKETTTKEESEPKGLPEGSDPLTAPEAFTDTLESVAASVAARSFSAAYETAQRILRSRGSAAVRGAMGARETYALHAYSVLALLAMGMAREAVAELADLGPLDAPGLPVPFLLHYLAAVAPLQTDAKLAPERLYALYWHCERERNAAAGEDAPATTQAEWDRRETLVLRTAAARHLALREPQLAAMALERVVALAPTDPRALTELGRVHYMLGCRDECRALLAEAARHAPPEGAAAAALNRALLLLADGSDADALAQLQAQCSSSRTSSALANNTAVCHMFCGELDAALRVFRGAVDAAPAAVSDATRNNMFILFELTSSQPDVLKKQLLAQIQKAKSLASF